MAAFALIDWYANLNGYLQFLIILPFFIALMLALGLVVAYATEKEMENYARKFEEKNGRAPDPNDPDDWPEPPSMWP